MDGMTTPHDIRSHFAIPDDLVFMNMSARSVIPQATVAAGREGSETKGHPWTIDLEADLRRSEEVRTLFANLIGAMGDDIAIHPSCAYGIATAAKILDLPKGKSILVLEDQFPSNVLIWEEKAADAGGSVVVVPRPADNDWTQAILERLDDSIAIAALPPGHWTDGTRIDLARIAPALKDLGAAFVVDATQWIGVQPIDVVGLGIDVLSCAAYKWLLGPYGLAFCYIAPKHQNARSLEYHAKNSKASGGRRFDVGEFMNYISLPIIHTSLSLVHEWGGPTIGDRLAPITTRIADGARSLGFDVADTALRSPHIVTMRRTSAPFEQAHADTLADMNIYASARGGGLRFSPYLFSTETEADRVLEALEKM